MIEHHIAVADIPTTVLIPNIGNPSEIEKNILSEELIAKGHKRSPLSTAHHIIFSEVANHIES